jgi:hypothetical protein
MESAQISGEHPSNVFDAAVEKATMEEEKNSLEGSLCR